MNFSVTKSVIEDIKADAKLILSNRKGSEGKPDVRALAKKHGCSRTTIRNVPNAATSRHLGPRSSQATGDTFHVVQRRESEDRSDNQPSSAILDRGHLLRDRRCDHHRRGSALGGCSCRDHRRRPWGDPRRAAQERAGAGRCSRRTGSGPLTSAPRCSAQIQPMAGTSSSS
ncbi:hypothetical protein JG687_00016780 [Phytophthora cactorum]|uniref:Uncharacterized protein n=1 Tax=Phytophthora cactorum TaxID=29920 RepID=A0A8T1TT72_9STRA|nr:hypothetical protein JG687_00016780 [Phytophthora cactorum]